MSVCVWKLGASFLSFDFLVFGISLGFLVLLLVLSTHFVFSLYSSDMGLVWTSLMQSLWTDSKALFSGNYSYGSFLVFLSLFVFIVLQNLSGLLFYVYASTSQMYLSFTLAAVFWFGCLFLGLMKNSTKVISHLVPLGTPVYLCSFMVLVEMISILIRPITLSVRLAANLTAGHLLLGIMSSGLMVFPMFVLELMVAFIQGYVFMMLTILYLEEVL